MTYTEMSKAKKKMGVGRNVDHQRIFTLCHYSLSPHSVSIYHTSPLLTPPSPPLTPFLPSP